MTIVLTALAAMVLQLLIVAARTYLNESDLQVTYVSYEVDQLAAALKVDRRRARLRGEQARHREDRTRLRGDRVPAHFQKDVAGAYAFRIRSADSNQIASHNVELIKKYSPWSSPNEAEGYEARQDMWLVRLDPDRRLHVAGGKRVVINGHVFLIEVATLGDPAFASSRILVSEIVDDVWMPMIPLIVLTLGATVVVVRRSMRPLADMSKLAEENQLARIDLVAQQTSLPQEVQSFVATISKLVERVHDLLAAQRAFVARAAHELRTPLAAMTLETERPGGADKSRLQSDISVLRQIVDQLLVLARLETKEVSKAEQLNLEFLAEEVIEQAAPLARKNGHKVCLRALQPTSVTGDAISIQHALRNLLHNAFAHTPAGTQVIVTVGPGACFSVADNGPGWGSYDTSESIEPFRKGALPSSGTGLGLSIVQGAAEVLGGGVTLGVSETGGAEVVVDWRSTRNYPVLSTVRGSHPIPP